MTIALPTSRLERLGDLIVPLLQHRKTSQCKCCHTIWRPPLVLILQHTLIHPTQHVTLTSLIKWVLQDWLHLAATVNTFPIPIHTLVPCTPDIIAATNASKVGMGSFWITPLTAMSPATHNVWRAPFSFSIQQALITDANPESFITNSDLGASPFTLHATYTPGTTNVIADRCSRSFFMLDSALLTHLNTQYPVQPSWTLVRPPQELLSNMNCTLSMKLPPLASPPVPNNPVTQRGLSGQISAGPPPRPIPGWCH